MFGQLVFTFFITFLCYFFLPKLKKALNGFYRKASEIPGPPSHLVLGSIQDIVATNGGIYQWLVETRRKYGPVYKFWLLDTLHIMLGDPDDVQLLLKSQKALQKSYGYNYMRPLMGDGLITSFGDTWREHRKIITPAFHFNILEKFVDVFNENTKILMSRLKNAQESSDSLNIHSYVTLCALDIICETAMGTKIDAQISGGHNDYVHAVNVAANMVVLRYYTLIHRYRFISWFTPLGREYERCLKLLLSTTDKIIRTRRQEIIDNKSNPGYDIAGKRRLAFLDLLLHTRHTDGSGLTDKEIRDEVNTLMVAGHETTSIGISTCCYLLSIHQDVQSKIVAELKEIFGDSDRAPTYEDLQRMNYLERTIKESLRMMPSIAEIQRYVDEDFELKNYTIPAGSTVGVMVYAMNLNPDVFPNPGKFDPDRFLPDNSKTRHPFAYIPFSGGYRNCIGQKFALYEMKTVISTILRNFKIEPTIDPDTKKIFEPMIEERVTTQSTNGIYINLTKTTK